MIRIIFIALLVVSSSVISAQEDAPNVLAMYAQYYELIGAGQANEALEVALAINKVDPADTRSLLYIVVSSVQSGVSLPGWVLGEPWPDASPDDRWNRKIAEYIANDT